MKDYQILAKIYESQNSIVYRARQKTDGQSVILKILKQDYPSPQELVRYKQEYEITRSLNFPEAIAVYALEPYNRTLMAVVEDFGGESLRKILSEVKTGLPLEQFLEIGIKIAENLGNIHGANVIHKDINPSNIVFNRKTEQLKIIDFGISTKLNQENPNLKNPNILEGTLAYISPEQTGRMNRSLDYRTDFYSLGVTFYELLTGQLPYNSEDALELIHCHLAQEARSPQKINPEIPVVVSNLVMKLMAKTAEERYQSAWGITADLKECLSQLKTSGNISEFPLGKEDISDKFQIPQKLYGREQEIETLLTAFYRVAASLSSKEMMLVRGYAGIGKSTLVREIYKSITEKQGYFISGKFEQFQRNIPYSGLVDAFKGLVKQLLTETEEELNQWREKIREAVGVNGRVIIDLIPELELIIGPQPEVAELGLNESQNRFNLIFKSFLRAFCNPEHPLVIFLDDLQWADSASLNLIELIMTDGKLQSLFVIGAYRDNEVNLTHPLIVTIEDLRSEGTMIDEITLAPLELENISQLIAETLHADRESVVSLANLVREKTKGNPFFINEFLNVLYAKNLVYFHAITRSWQWGLAKIQGQKITDNVVDLTVANLKKMPESQQQILSMAACVGAEFYLNTLGIICEQSTSEIFVALEAAVQSGFIIATSELDHRLLIENYKFRHDRIQQAAYSLIDEAEKKAIHLKIGKLLLENSNSENPGERIFEIIDHLNRGAELIQSEIERYKLARLNLIAGQKAKAATAYSAAAEYLKQGRDLLGKYGWKIKYPLSMALYVEGVELAFINGNFQEQEELSNVVMEKGKSLLEKVEVYEFKILAYQSNNQLLEAIQTALELLKLLDVNFPKAPTYSDIEIARNEIQSKLANQEISELIDLTPMVYPYKLAVMQILSRMISITLQGAPLLLPLIICKQVDLSLEYGNAAESTYAYSMYGCISIGIFFDIDLGDRFGELALNLVSKLNATSFKAKTIFGVNLFIKPWKEPLDITLKPLLSAYQIGLETGDTEYAALSLYVYCYHKYVSGKELGKLKEELLLYRKVIMKLKQKTYFNYHSIYCQLVLNLMGESENPCRLIGENYDEKQMLPLHLEGNDTTALALVYIHKTILYCLFGEDAKAIENALIAKKYLASLVGFFLVATFYFYESLAYLAMCHKEEIEKLLVVDENQEKMKIWAQHAPCNCQHKYDLVAAEKARVFGENWQAIKLYDRAIKGAKENGFQQEEALAYELAAKFYWAEGMDKIAETYMKEAHYGYIHWGATAKVEALEAKYPELKTQTAVKTTIISEGNKTVSARSSTGSREDLDLTTLMKASQAISGEITLEKLLAKLIKILIENAGAETGYLILETEGKFKIEALARVGDAKVTVLQSLALENHLPVSIINYVARTKTSVVFNDVTARESLANDVYIKTNKPQSILCSPLINQGKIAGILYLENKLTKGVFTPDRLEVLNLLSSQAAIAIDNARLYSQLEDNNRLLESRVKERTFQLAEATEKAQAANEAKSNFLANMSHELRSPLNTIIGFSQLMNRSHSLPKEHQENVGIINRSGEHLLTLINQVLDLSKIEAGQITLNENNFDLYRLLDDVEDMLSLKAEDKGLQLLVERSDDLPRYLNSDEVKLRQVLINLMNNAIKFTPEGGVFLKVATQEVNATNSQISLSFEVEDTGAGIAPEELDSLFEAFVQTSTGKKSQEGTGLGLPISKKFVELMGGEMTVISEVGRGSTFKFNIQASVVEASKIMPRKLSHNVVALQPNQPRYKILIVDDKWESRQLLIKLLNPLGFELKEASNGREAVEVWENWQPDLIWMDLRMPIMNGYEAIQEIKSSTKGQTTAIIALTASILEEEKAVVLSVGCDDFLRKPFRESEIFEMMAKHLGVRYIYEDSAEKSEVNSSRVVTSAYFQEKLSPELMANLEMAIFNLDTAVMTSVVEEIRLLDSALAERISRCLNNFEYDFILNLIADK